MNPQEMRQRAAALRDQAAKMASNRSMTPDEKENAQYLLHSSQDLILRAEEAERAEGFTGVSKPYGSVRSGRTKDEAGAITGRYIRSGDVMAGQEMNAAAIEEIRASNDSSWNITTPADGGYLVPTGHHKGIIARRDEFMLADKIGVRRIPGTAQTVNVPVDAENDGEFATTAEQNDAHGNNYDRDQAALATVAMSLVKKTKKVELTEELIRSEDSQLMPFIEDWVGRGFARTHNSLLCAEVLATATAALTLDSSSTIGAAEVPELAYLLQEEYEDGAVWLMRRTTESILRQKTGDSFQFVAGSVGNDQARRDLWGHPLYTSQYMAAVGASGKSMIFGNFNFVGLREAPTLSLLRDPYSVDGMLILKYSFRVCYKTLQSEALVMATHPTA